MKTIYFLRIFLLLFLILCLSQLPYAQNFSLIDVNKIKSSSPRNEELSTKNAFMLYRGFSYFSADDGIHGRELWRTNGSAAGTKLIKDVNPGTASSDIYDYSIITSGNNLYFSADDGINGKELWISNGTTVGTHLVTDIAAGESSSNPQYLTDVNGTLFFVVSFYDPYVGFVNQLWKSDGTAANTVLVKDFPNGYPPQNLVNSNGRLFFVFYDFNLGAELYTSDGTSDGTGITTDLNPYGGSFPRHLTALNGLLYFTADDGTGGRLCVSDGTPAGTHAVSNTNNINLPVNYDFFSEDNRFRDSFAIISNVLYFQGSSFEAGNELCSYNTADAGANVNIVKDIIAGSNSSYPSFITPVNNTLFFTIGPAGEDAQLWKSDGSELGTVLVKDISPGGDNFYYGLTSAFNSLLFAYGNSTSGFDLWRSNGTEASTTIVKDIAPGIYSSFPQYIAYNNGLFLFGASDLVNGFELWKSDGTNVGTVMVKDINQTSSGSSNPYGMTGGPNGKVIFTGYDDKYGNELRVTDASTAAPNLLKDIYPGTFSSHPYLYTTLQNKTYFFAGDRDGIHLWKSNGTAAGTTILNIPGLFDNNQYVSNMFATGNLLYILVYNYGTNQMLLWRSDGTAANSYIVKADIAPYFAFNFIAVGNTLYFTNYDDNGYELWKTEGTASSTSLLKDINPGYLSSNPTNLTNFNGKLYFSAYDGGALGGNSFWTSDGTTAGTKLVKPILVMDQPFAVANGKLFLYALNAVAKGYELFSSDGTKAGTQVVKDIYPGPAGSNVSALMSADPLVYFFADDGVHGNELWKSDGNKDGTRLVKDITPGISGTYANYLAVAGKQLFFTIYDSLWQSDGTKNGTHRVNDATLDGVSNISNLKSIYGNLYFSGYTYAAGNELYMGTPAAISSPIQMISADQLISSPVLNGMSAKLLTNPIIDQLAFSVDVRTIQLARITIMDAAGKVLSADRRTLGVGSNKLTYNLAKLPKGMYTISIVTNKKYAVVLRAIK